MGETQTPERDQGSRVNPMAVMWGMGIIMFVYVTGVSLLSGQPR